MATYQRKLIDLKSTVAPHVLSVVCLKRNFTGGPGTDQHTVRCPFLGSGVSFAGARLSCTER